MKLQHIKDDGTLVNLHPFGRDLREFLNSEDQMALLEPFGHGWMDGGCWTLAQALRCWSNGALQLKAVLTLPELEPTHVVAYFNGMYIDGDGLATAEELINKMRLLEGVANCTIGEFSEDPDEYFDLAFYWPIYKPLINKLITFFHDFDEGMLNPDSAASFEEVIAEEDAVEQSEKAALFTPLETTSGK